MVAEIYYPVKMQIFFRLNGMERKAKENPELLKMYYFDC